MNETTMNVERAMLGAIPISKTEACLRAETHRQAEKRGYTPCSRCRP